MVSVKIEKATAKGKKYKAIFFDDKGKRIKTSQFGQAGADDYTITKDKMQRKRYRDRHEKDLKSGDYMKPGFLSYYILWGNSTSLQTNIKDYRKRFGLKKA